MQMKVVDATYKAKEDLQVYLEKFAKEYAPKGKHRIALKDLKTNMHWDTHQKLVNGGLTLMEVMGAKPFDLSILKGKL